MKKNKMKLLGLLFAVACASVFGAGAAAEGREPMGNIVAAQAEQVTEYTTYELTDLALYGLSLTSPTADKLRLRGTGYNNPAVDIPLTLESGVGLAVNGEKISWSTFKHSTATFFYIIFDAVNVGDVVTVGGTFVNEEKAVKFVFEETSFKWTGTAWEKQLQQQVEFTTYELTGLSLYGLSVTSPTADKLRLRSADYKNPAEDIPLTLESGVGLAVNGEQISWTTFKNTTNQFFYIVFPKVNTGDVVKIGGTFVNNEKGVKFVFEETEFIWNGTAWERNVEYTTYEIGAVQIGKWEAEKNYLHLRRADGEEIIAVPDGNGGWTETLRSKNGVGVTLNGESISGVKFPNEIFVEFPESPTNGDVLKVGGTFYSGNYAVQYVVEESVFVYQDGEWKSQLEIVKMEATETLETYWLSFVESDYYETEWASLEKIFNDGKTDIGAATSNEGVEAVLNAAKAAMDEVATKEEMDANFAQWLDAAKAELEGYKDTALYRESEQEAIAAIVAKAKTDIDGCESWTALNDVVTKAKADMDALWTAEQWTAAEEAVATAKAELAAYKTESDYRTAEWESIQSIIAEANKELDSAIGNATAIADCVTSAKAKMDEVKTREQAEAEEQKVLDAKAELESYKSEEDYNAPEWAEIQNVLSGAYTALDGAIGNDGEIANIVANAKEAMDKVLKAEEANAKAFAEAKENAEEEIQAYASAIDYSLYSDEAMEEINGYVMAALDAVDAATQIEEFATIVSTMKTNIEGVEKIANDSSSGSSSSVNSGSAGGCNSVVGMVSGVTLLAVATAVGLRKKKDD